MNNRCTGEVGRARKKLKEMPENSGYKTSSDGLHACCAFVIHNKKKKLDFSEDLSQLPCEQNRFESYSNAFDLTALSRVKQTTLSSSGEKNNL